MPPADPPTGDAVAAESIAPTPPKPRSRATRRSTKPSATKGPAPEASTTKKPRRDRKPSSPTAEPAPSPELEAPPQAVAEAPPAEVAAPAVLGVEWLAPPPTARLETEVPADATTPACPSCGRARLGQFRYCLTCGFDYDAGDRAPSVAAMPSDIRVDAGIRPVEPSVLYAPGPIPGVAPTTRADTEPRRAWRRDPPPEAPRSPAPESAGIPIGGGAFTVTRRTLIVAAIVVGVAAAVLVTLILGVLGRLF
jgi:hypothetical protein